MPRQTSSGGSAADTESADQQEWAEALKRWWNLSAAGNTDDDAALREKIVDQGLSYLVFGDRALNLMRDLTRALEHNEDWQAVLQRNMATLHEAFLERLAGGGSQNSALATFWGLPLDAWRRLTATLALDPAAGAAPLADQPPRQSLDAETQALWQAYQAAANRYNALLHETAAQALKRLEQRLEEHGHQGTPIDSLRGFYNLWVECGEQAHGDMLDRPDHGRLHGQLINALLRLKRHQRAATAEHWQGLHPGLNAMDTLSARLQDSRRRIDALQKQLAASDSRQQQLEDQLQALLKRVRELEGDGS